MFYAFECLRAQVKKQKQFQEAAIVIRKAHVRFIALQFLRELRSITLAKKLVVKRVATQKNRAVASNALRTWMKVAKLSRALKKWEAIQNYNNCILAYRVFSSWKKKVSTVKKWRRVVNVVLFTTTLRRRAQERFHADRKDFYTKVLRSSNLNPKSEPYYTRLNHAEIRFGTLMANVLPPDKVSLML